MNDATESLEVFGHIRSAAEIEDAALEALRSWMPRYAAVVARQRGIAPANVEPIRSWGIASDYETWPENNLPALIVVVPGLADTPTKDGAGYYSASWSMEVSVTLAAATVKGARELGQLYAAAVRGAILQRRSLGGPRSARWVDEAYGAVPNAQRKGLFVAANVFHINQRNVVSDQMGPATSEPPGPDAWPTIEEVNPEVTP